MSSRFRTRQAPSPTGYLHLGTARTMLFTLLITKINKGEWYLRLEDTDRSRLQPEAAKNLLEILEVLNLAPTEGVSIKGVGELDDFYEVCQNGKYAPYIQSERLHIYHQHAQNLIDKKLAYWSYHDQSQRDELQEIKEINKDPINWFKSSSDVEILGCAESEVEKYLYASVETALADKRNPVLRYKLQRAEKIVCEDLLLGKTEFNLSLEEDLVLLKSDSFPTYHLAHLVDDHLMETTLVIRAQEWFASMPKHVLMFKEYWGEVPAYIHLPFILGETGNKKMSKRDGNVNMQDYLDEGYLEEAIINYLSFLGWNPGTEKELYLNEADFS